MCKWPNKRLRTKWYQNHAKYNKRTDNNRRMKKKNYCKIKSESTVSKHALTYTDELEFWNCAIAQKIARGWPIYENHLKNCTISLSVDFWLHKQFVCCCYFYFSSFSSFHSFSLLLSANSICWQFAVDVLSMNQHFFFQIDADY